MAAEFKTYYQSPIGLISITGNDTLINSIQFADTHQPEHEIQFDSGSVTPLSIECTEQLIQYFHGARRSFDLPLDQDGTVFQQKVWAELQAIPYGRTINYLELARRLGDPKTIRAAASANGRNNLAIVIPCHRVIGSRNDLVGYMGGLWRKKWLLDHENKTANGVQTLF